MTRKEAFSKSLKTFLFAMCFVLGAVSSSGASERVLLTKTVQPGEEVMVDVSSEEASLLGWKMSVDAIEAVDSAAECEANNCGELRSSRGGFILPGRFGALKSVAIDGEPVALSGLGPLTFRNNSTFTYSVDFIVLR